jgi:hypothetical protein
VAALSDAGEFVTQVAVGSRHMFSLSREGRVFSWGNGEYGRCGNGKKKQLLPEPVALLEDKRVVQVASGHQHGLAVTAEGGVWVWGKNDAGQLGVGGSVLMDLNTMEEFPLLLEVEAERKHEWDGQVAAVAAGGNHSLAMMRDGRVFQWGQRTFLQPQAVEFGYLKPADDGEAEETGTKRGKEGSIPLRAVQVSWGLAAAAVRGIRQVWPCFRVAPPRSSAACSPPLPVLAAGGRRRGRLWRGGQARAPVHVGQEPQHGHARAQHLRGGLAPACARGCAARHAPRLRQLRQQARGGHHRFGARQAVMSEHANDGDATACAGLHDGCGRGMLAC